MAQKIKMVKFAQDAKTNVPYQVNDIIDLGKERNTNAVNAGLAVWVDSTEFEAAKKELAAETEKKEGTPKKTTTSAKGKTIQTK